MNNQRWINAFPVIGILPVIDARHGAPKVRECLKNCTVSMDRAACGPFCKK